MEQWTNVHGIDQVADSTDTVAGYPHKIYTDSAGVARVETYSITGMGHGTPVDPGTGASQCGTAGAYILDANICSSYYIGHFWGLDDLDGTAPTVALTAPAEGATVSGNVALTANASDDIGVGPRRVPGSTATWSAAMPPRPTPPPGTRPSPATVRTPCRRARHTVDNGYVKAGSGGSAPAVGTLEAYQGLAIGRGTDGKFNRTLLSFDTSAIPDGATVTSATVTVQYRSASGNPWTNPAGNALLVDVQRGCLGACTIEAADWGAAVTAGSVAQVPAFTGGSQASTTFSAAGVAAVNVAGRTQLRLRFGQEQARSNYVWVGTGATALLSVTYVP